MATTLSKSSRVCIQQMQTRTDKWHFR